MLASEYNLVILCQVMTLDKTFLDAPVRRLPARLMRSVDVGLRLALSLG